MNVSDHDTTNNDSDGQGAAEITIVPRPEEMLFEDQFPSQNINRTNWWTVDNAIVDDAKRR